jgi:hypothetical protein
MRSHLRHGLVGALCFSVALVVGCSGGSSGDKGVMAKGKLLQNGQPAKVEYAGTKQLPPGETGRMTVWFYPVKADNDVIIGPQGDIMVQGGEKADVESDGTFKLGGGDGKGIPPGKYRVVVTHIDPFTSKDVLKGMFSEGNSRVTREVKGPDEEIVIDLAKRGG